MVSTRQPVCLASSPIFKLLLMHRLLQYQPEYALDPIVTTGCPREQEQLSNHEPHHHENECCAREAAPTEMTLTASAAGNLQTTLQVAGVDCAEEVSLIQRALKPLRGVRDVRVNIMSGKAIIAHDETITPDVLIKVIGEAGVKAIREGEKAGDKAQQRQKQRLLSVSISGVLTVLCLLAHWAHFAPESVTIALFLATIISGGWFIAPKAVAAARRLSPDVNLLMAIAVVGAAGIGEWSEGAAMAFLFALSELLESFSVARARRAIQSLLKLAPQTALRNDGDRFVEVPVEKVHVGGIIAVKSGARVPLDGAIVNGDSSIDQAPITGESMPVEKKQGDQVFAGTINGEGSLEVRVTKNYSDTTLSKIIHLVEEAQSQKASSQRFVDVFAKYYTPSVMALAFLVFLLPPMILGAAWGVWFYRALVLLVIACPCALVISTPVSIVSGLTAMARRGVLIKGGAFLEAVGKLKALAVDKTGTITEGRPRVTRVVSIDSTDEAEIVWIAAAIDTHSDHPLAQAVVEYAEERGVNFPRSENYQAHTGRGAEAEVGGHHYFVGNHRFAHELAVCSDAIENVLADIEEQGQSVVVVGHKPHADCAGQVLGIVAVGDTMRPNAPDAIRSLHATGVQKVVMLSGDNQRTVNAIARQAGVDEAYGDLLPDQKIEHVRKLLAAYIHVGMIGDGVNDAPAMAAATIGIAMGAAGTDTAIETADIALMKDDLSKVAEAVHLGRQTLRIIQTNIIFALAVKALFLALALFGYTSLWLAILADTGATLLVILNALRVLR
jgi:Cd2+/Zn2+-exporting ATPase